MAELYAEGRPADDNTAEEIIRRLEDHRNYIPPSERTRREYSYVVLKEYRKYVRRQSEDRR
ncbi:MAG TPA: hypothetical protein PK874_10125 [Desulfobacteraceae bacterium]|nr:hypothetical protein [Desulfobacteraceae bacterium]